MSKRSQEIQVGLAVIASVAVLIAGLLWLQGERLDRTHVEAWVHFNAVGGLGKGDPVHVRGIPLGKVLDVSLQDDGVLVTVQVDERVRLTSESEFEVGTTGIMGDRVVLIKPGDGGSVDLARHVFQGTTQPLATDMISQAEELGDKLSAFLDRVDGVVASVQDEQGLAEAVDAAAASARSVRELVRSISGEVETASRSVSSVSVRMDTLLTRKGDTMERGVEDLATAAARLDSLADRLHEVTTGAEHILSAVQNQEGALGRLIYDKDVSTNMVKAVEEARVLIADIRENPDRYINLSLIRF